MIFLFILFLCQMQAATESEPFVLSEEAREVMFSSSETFLTDPMHSADELAECKLRTLKPLEDFEKDTYERVKAFMRASLTKLHRRNPSAPVPFYCDIDHLSKSFDEFFSNIKLPLFKSLYKACLLFRACEGMSRLLDSDIPKGRYPQLMLLPNSEEALQQALFVLKKKHNNWRGSLIPEFYLNRIGSVEIRYEYTKSGSFSLLEYMACLRKGVLMLTVMEPQEGSHKVFVHSKETYMGLAQVFHHDTEHTAIILDSLRFLHEGFEPAKPNKENYRVLIDMAFKHLSSLPDDRAKARWWVTFFCWVHEAPNGFIARDTFFTDSAAWRLGFHESLQVGGSGVDEGVFRNLVMPVCTQQELNLLDEACDDYRDPKKADKGSLIERKSQDILKDVLEEWHNENFKIFRHTLRHFKVAQIKTSYKMPSLDYLPWVGCADKQVSYTLWINTLLTIGGYPPSLLKRM